MKRLLQLFSLLLLPFALTVMAEEPAKPKFEEDQHYFPIIPEQPGAEGNRVEVMEFFWYGCGHCYKFEPYLQAWLKNKPENVDFSRVPAMFNRPNVVMHAQTYYALNLMKADPSIHDKIFDAMHKEERKLDTQETMEAFLGERGINIEEYRKAMKSFAVATQAKRAQVLAERFDINGVPAIVVDGKYRSGNVSGNDMVGVTNFLVEKITAQKGGASVPAAAPTTPVGMQ